MTGVEFDSNSCDTTNCGDDIYAYQGYVGFSTTTCNAAGSKFPSTPSAGTALSIVSSSGTLEGVFFPTDPTSLTCSGTCAAGTYVDPKVGNTCLPNPVGSYSAITGTAYTICPAGKYSTLTSSISSGDCLVCPKGRYSDGFRRTSSCFVCGAGTYNDDDTTSSSACTTCPAGRTQTDDGTDASLHDNADDCDVVCAAGRYYDGIEATGCVDCPIGKYLYDESAVGFHDELEDCQTCGQGTAASSPGSAICTTCPVTAAGTTDDHSSCIFDEAPSSTGISILGTLSSADTLRLSAGSYTGVGVDPVVELSIPIYIVCTNDDQSCILSGSNTREAIRYSSASGKLVLRSLKITQGRSFGIHVSGVGSVDIINCLISDNFNDASEFFSSNDDGGSGIRMTTSDSTLNLYGVTLSNNLFEESHMPYDGVGDISNTGGATIEGEIFVRFTILHRSTEINN